MNRRRFIILGTTGLAGLAGCLGGTQPQQQNQTNQTNQTNQETAQETEGRHINVKQESGSVVYWVPPGKRRLSEKVFGTPQNPKSLLKPKLQKVDNVPQPLRENVRKTIQNLPILAGLPKNLRETNQEETQYTKTTIPTPFPDTGMVTSGELDITYKDIQSGDSKGSPTETKDNVELTTSFTDPSGNEYSLNLKNYYSLHFLVIRQMGVY